MKDRNLIPMLICLFLGMFWFTYAAVRARTGNQFIKIQFDSTELAQWRKLDGIKMGATGCTIAYLDTLYVHDTIIRYQAYYVYDTLIYYINDQHHESQNINPLATAVGRN